MNRFCVTASAIAFSCASTVACSFLFPFDGYAGDAGDAATEASAFGFCASQNPTPTFCADFDEPSPVQWQSQLVSDAGMIEVDDARSSSPPNSLLATVTPATYPHAFDVGSLGTSANEVTVEADIWFEAVDPSTFGANVLGIAAGAGPTFMTIRLDVTSTGKAIVTYNGSAADGGSDPVNIGPTFTMSPLGTATPFHVKMHVNLSTSTVDCSVNGVAEVSGAIVPRTLSMSQPIINVGLYYPETTTNGWKVRYDNIVANAQ